MNAILLALVLAPSGSEQQTTPHSPKPVDFGWRALYRCGPNALYLMLRMAGKSVDYQALVSEMQIGDRGVNIADLCRVAHLYGLDLTPLRAQASALESLPLPAIVHFNNPGDNKGHYVVLLALNGELGCSIMECTSGTYEVLSKGSFLDRWSGVVLVRSDNLPGDDSDSLLLGLSAVSCFLVVLCFVPFTFGKKVRRPHQPLGLSS